MLQTTNSTPAPLNQTITNSTTALSTIAIMILLLLLVATGAILLLQTTRPPVFDPNEFNGLPVGQEQTIKATGLAPKPTSLPTGGPTSAPKVPSKTPYAEAPACTSHNPIQWHALWDSVRGCHYDHTHNADPAEANVSLGAFGKLANGQSIGYPWETNHENHHKHQGYKYAVASNLPCAQATYEFLSPVPGCVKTYRLQYHNVGGYLDGLVRFHSYFAEVQVCSIAGVCGVVRTGGHADFGILQVPYKTGWMPLPEKDPPALKGLNAASASGTLDLNLDPYRAFAQLSDVESMSSEWAQCQDCAGAGRELRTTWTTNNPYTGADWSQSNQIVGFKFWVFDDWGGFNPGNPKEYKFVCPTYRCRFNSTEHAIFEVTVVVPASLDPDGDGRVTFQGFSDLDGNIATNCKVAGPKCVPLSIEDAPVGEFIYSFQAPNYNIDEIKRDFDLSPQGVWWVKYPN